jgi:hypothetical protein
VRQAAEPGHWSIDRRSRGGRGAGARDQGCKGAYEAETAKQADHDVEQEITKIVGSIRFD